VQIHHFVGEDQVVFDHRVKELIGDEVRSASPDSASVILGT
jgi:hypothetical protein